jgi:hypothetical protein
VNVLARFEAACSRFVEDAFARVFPSDLDPAHVGRKLVAVMQSAASDVYLVRVHPVDYARFAHDRDFLEARWSALLREAQAPGRSETPRAVLHEDARVVAGSLVIEAVVDERPVPLAFERGDRSRIGLVPGLTLGRANDNATIFHDPRVSRHHARIVADGDGLAIEDLGSSNGTFMNGELIRRARLSPGATLTLGDTTLVVVPDV